MALTPTELAKALSISAPYASQLLSGNRAMPRELAIRLYRATGEKIGPIAGATDEEIEILEAFPERVKLGKPANDSTSAQDAAA